MQYKNQVYILMGLALFGVLQFHFITLIFSILITYICIEKINKCVFKTHSLANVQINNSYSNMVTSLVIFAILACVIWFISSKIFGLIQADSINLLLSKLESILLNIKENPNLPVFISEKIPDSIIELKTLVFDNVGSIFSEIQNFSKYGLAVFLYIILGMIIAMMLSFHQRSENQPVFKQLMLERIINFKLIFNTIFGAQVKISLIDTVLTGIYLLVILPLCGVDFPFAITVLIIAFLVGLLPVIGNLISNSIIVILSLGISINVALASLAFLVIIHKFEYFLNAKIIGKQINSSAWEILLAMIIFEHIFGISGIILAPFYYAYIKYELSLNKLI